MASPARTPGLKALWAAHCAAEFEHKDAAAAVETMTQTPYVNHVPTLAGGVGKQALLRFYASQFIPCNPPDLELKRISLTVGTTTVVEELVLLLHAHVRHPVAPAGRCTDTQSLYSCRWWRLSRLRATKSRQNTYTGIKQACLSKSAFYSRTACLLCVLRPRARYWTSRRSPATR